MAVVERFRDITAHADLVWRVITDDSVDGTAPGAERIVGAEGAEESRVLHIRGEDNREWRERCVAWSDQRHFTMEVDADEFPLAVNSLRYTGSLADAGGMLRLRLYFDYQPSFGWLGALLDRFRLRDQLVTWADRVLDHWVRRIHTREWAYRMTVGQLLNEKGRHIHAVPPGATVSEAADLLRSERIGSVMVMEKDDSIAGVLSERDIARALPERGQTILDEPVSSLMTRDVIVAHPDDNMMVVMSCMSDNRIRHLPVIDEQKVIGVISIGDVVKARISELEGQSETLRDYIQARRWNELYREIGPAAYDPAIASTIEKQPEGAKL